MDLETLKNKLREAHKLLYTETGKVSYKDGKRFVHYRVRDGLSMEDRIILFTRYNSIKSSIRQKKNEA